MTKESWAEPEMRDRLAAINLRVIDVDGAPAHLGPGLDSSGRRSSTWPTGGPHVSGFLADVSAGVCGDRVPRPAWLPRLSDARIPLLTQQLSIGGDDWIMSTALACS